MTTRAHADSDDVAEFRCTALSSRLYTNDRLVQNESVAVGWRQSAAILCCNRRRLGEASSGRGPNLHRHGSRRLAPRCHGARLLPPHGEADVPVHVDRGQATGASSIWLSSESIAPTHPGCRGSVEHRGELHHGWASGEEGTTVRSLVRLGVGEYGVERIAAAEPDKRRSDVVHTPILGPAGQRV